MIRTCEMTMAELESAGLLHAEERTQISPFAMFLPADAHGTCRPVTVQAGAVIEAFSIIHGGCDIGPDARVEAHAIVGVPERGYAADGPHDGTGDSTVLGAETVVRSGAVIYAGSSLGEHVLVGHYTLLRTAVTVGGGSQLGHHLTIERATRIGRDVRCSPGSHLTSACVLADRVFLGAGVRTINDKTLTWRRPGRSPVLDPPRFDHGARIGTGCVVLGGVTIGHDALVGAGSLITRDVPPGALAYGHPARVHGRALR
jgi:acetyltransferase-like isoleucine patch superfamily enzyme